MASKSFDARVFVDGVVNEFESRTGFHLSGKARDAVVRPAYKHRFRIDEEVAEGSVDPNDIAEAVTTLLRNAMTSAMQSRRALISESDVAAAKRKECKYFPWC